MNAATVQRLTRAAYPLHDCLARIEALQTKASTDRGEGERIAVLETMVGELLRVNADLARRLRSAQDCGFSRLANERIHGLERRVAAYIERERAA